MSWLDQVAAKIQKNGIAEILAEKNCFVVDEDTFREIVKMLNAHGWEGDVPWQALTRLGYEGITISLSSRDRERYILCTPSRVILDDLWRTMYASAEKEAPQ